MHANSSRRRGLHLWAGSPNETTPNTSNTRSGHCVWDARQDAYSGGMNFPFDTQLALIVLAQKPKRATPEVMSSFHTDEYVHFLHGVTPETAEKLTYSGTRCEFAQFSFFGLGL